jgi:parallel beta-helix repeat protein
VGFTYVVFISPTSDDTNEEPVHPQKLTPHAPIRIDGDADLMAQAIAENWTGSGVPGDPIAIEGYQINDTQIGIRVQQVHEVSLVIRNCSVTTNDMGWGYNILVEESADVRIENCIVNYGASGITFVLSTDCVVRNCTAISVVAGLNSTLSINTKMIGNSVHDAWVGFIIIGDNYSLLENNYIENCTTGIISQHSHNVTTADVIITNCKTGFLLDWGSNNWNITSCSIVNNSLIGIKVENESAENLIYNNDIGFNSLNAEDNGISNSWDYEGIGNAWHDWIGLGVYTIPGSSNSVDNFPRLLSEP